ncbi:RDD family protein [Sphingomonas sp. AX6]|uniref:RDD family protein n=1 Tax=Sphingomonas sp. AX6 TaxID=2653171 RepID=UPI0012F248BD|nr:RDD family protein [Sphingomonas sp. AX6]VXC59551.1 RDD family protein [Sphingomonas sp. AX6]
MARPPRTLDRALVTPEGVRLDIRLASVSARAGALLIDLLLMVVILALLTWGAVSLAQTGTAQNLVQIIWMLGFFTLRNFYFIAFESGARAATIGKRLVKLRVVARDGGRLTTGAVVARNLMREIELMLPLLTMLYAIGTDNAAGWFALGWCLLFVALPLCNRDRLRGGDIVAGTWVVEHERHKIGIDLLDRVTETDDAPRFSAEDLAVYGAFELQKLEAVLRRNDEKAIEAVATTIRGKLGRTDWGDDRLFLDAYYAALRVELEGGLLMGRRKIDKFDTT